MKRFDLSSTFFIISLIFIISVFFVLDLFLHRGQPTTFDGPTHISNIAQVYGGLREGELPVRWGQGFARYGMPIPLIAQQTTSYLGAVFNFITQDVVTSYNFVVFVGAFLSGILMYYFLRIYVSSISALSGAVLFMFAPYRIMNVYIRGALPEFFASVGIILILISMYHAIEKERKLWYLGLAGSVALLLLTHPFMMVVSSLIFIPYGIYLLSHKKNQVKPVLYAAIAGGLGLGLAAYFIVPLFLEIKYFYYGLATDHFVKGHFLNLKQFFIEQWFYFKNDVGPREHYHLGGMIEGIVLLTALGLSIFRIIKKRKVDLLSIFSIVGILYIFLMMSVSEPLYNMIPLLSNVQHPWRMLTGYIIIPPILFAFLLDKTKYKVQIMLGVFLILALLRFPQLYGKNYTQYNQDTHYVTAENLHGQVMNTIWMGKVSDYPYKSVKAEIIEGKGKIQEQTIKNSSREYTVQADTDIRMVDYTFYFPGWKVYVDDSEVPIEFQDMNYRGVITYKVPAGTHNVHLKLEETKIRMLGNAITLASLFGFGILYFIIKKYPKYL